MTTAIEALNRQRGRLRDPSITDNRLEIDVSRFLLDVQKSKKLDINVAGSIIDGEITRTMDGASTIAITLNDHNRKILRSGLLGQGGKDDPPAIDVNFNGLWFRLVNPVKSGNNLSLTFEDRIVAFLRSHRRPRKVSRREMTRAQFIHSMVREVKATHIEFFSPAEKVKQPIEAVVIDKTERRRQKKPGFHSKAKLKVKGSDANAKQIDTGGTILGIASDMGASDKVMVAAIATSITESTLNPNIGGDFDTHTHVGAFQQDSTANSLWRNLGGGTGNLTRDTKAFVIEAMKVDKQYPSLSPAMLAELTQYPGHRGVPSPQWTVYARTVDENVPDAREWVKQFNGGGGGNETVTRTRRKQYYFMRGAPDGPKGENTWDCSARLAQEVNWKRFVVGNTFFYVRDYDLMKQRPIDHLSEKDKQVEMIDFDMDTGKPLQEATITCRAVRWAAHPGEVIVIEDSGPANGKWLVQEITRKIFAPDCTITVRKSHGSQKEPAPETITQSFTKNQDIVPGRPYHGASGTVVLAANADRPGVPTHRHVILFVELMSGALGKRIVITTGSNHNQYTASGNISDHWSGNAADLGSVANHFAVGGRGGDDIARAAAEVLGLTLRDVTGNWDWHTWIFRNTEYRVQVGWRVPDHYDHVHVGVEKTGPAGPRRFRVPASPSGSPGH